MLIFKFRDHSDNSHKLGFFGAIYSNIYIFFFEEIGLHLGIFSLVAQNHRVKQYFHLTAHILTTILVKLNYKERDRLLGSLTCGIYTHFYVRVA